MLKAVFHKVGTVVSAMKTYASWLIWIMYRFGYNPHREILFKVRSGERFMLRVDQGELSPVDSIFREQSYNKYFQIGPGDIVVDIGANVGLYAIYASKRLRRNGDKIGMVYAYEPNKVALDRLERNIKLNNAGNVRVIDCAVTSDGRDVKLYNHSVGTVMATIRDIHEHNPGGYTIVRSVPFESVLMDTKCTFLKIDCEGAEYELFDVIKTEILGRVDKIVCEYHWQGCDGIEKKLKEAGFEVKIDRTPPFVPEWNSGTIYGIRK